VSLGACLPGLEAEGKLDADRAAELRARYDELIAHYVNDASPEAAEALASAQLVRQLEAEVTRKQFLAGRQVKARRRIEADMARYNGGQPGGPIDPAAGPAFLDRSDRAPYSNVEARRKQVIGDTHRLLGKLMADHSAGLRGQIRNKAQLLDVVRELFGESSGNATAKALATSWRQGAELLRRRFNAAGGDIGFRTDWGLPQSHDWQKVRAAGFDAWRAAILPRLDLSRMTDSATGLPITREKLELLLPQIWQDIRSQGAATRTPGSPAGGKMLANLRGDARFFVFRSATDWMDYADAFGAGSPYDAMMAHINGMARDIAAMEILGPNPQGTIDWLKDVLVNRAQRDMDPGSKGVERAQRNARKVDRLWDEYRGANMQPDSEGMALVFSNLRNVQVATKLGGAYLSAVSDFAFQATARAFNGLSSTGMLADYIKHMRPGAEADHLMAVRRGLIAEEWSGRTRSESRLMLDEMGSNWSRNLASGVMRLSLLSRHTQAVRHIYGLETLAAHTEAAGKTFAELDPAMRGAMQRYGIGADDWDKLRTAPMDTDGGAPWISPHRLDDQELGARFMEMIHTEVDFAVPMPDLTTRAALNSRLERGTVLGEAGRSLLQFKSFGISVQLAQWHRMMAMQPESRVRYLTGLVIGSMLTGAIAMQLKALAAGKDPRPMNDWRFGVAAMQQGGGFGILGDFLFSDHSERGGDLAATIAGPLVGDAQKIYNVAASDDPRGQLVRTVRGLVPGNSLWFARTAIDRIMADQVNEMINPDYRRSYRLMESYARDQGSGFWWQPGETMPARSPDMANALEGAPQQ
jgi:hypothetical protein